MVDNVIKEREMKRFIILVLAMLLVACQADKVPPGSQEVTDVKNETDQTIEWIDKPKFKGINQLEEGQAMSKSLLFDYEHDLVLKINNRLVEDKFDLEPGTYKLEAFQQKDELVSASVTHVLVVTVKKPVSPFDKPIEELSEDELKEANLLDYTLVYEEDLPVIYGRFQFKDGKTFYQKRDFLNRDLMTPIKHLDGGYVYMPYEHLYEEVFDEKYIIVSYVGDDGYSAIVFDDLISKTHHTYPADPDNIFFSRDYSMCLIYDRGARIGLEDLNHGTLSLLKIEKGQVSEVFKKSLYAYEIEGLVWDENRIDFDIATGNYNQYYSMTEERIVLKARLDLTQDLDLLIDDSPLEAAYLKDDDSNDVLIPYYDQVGGQPKGQILYGEIGTSLFSQKVTFEQGQINLWFEINLGDAKYYIKRAIRPNDHVFAATLINGSDFSSIDLRDFQDKYLKYGLLVYKSYGHAVDPGYHMFWDISNGKPQSYGYMNQPVFSEDDRYVAIASKGFVTLYRVTSMGLMKLVIIKDIASVKEMYFQDNILHMQADKDYGISLDFLYNPSLSVERFDQGLEIGVDILNLRSMPSTDSEVLGKAYLGQNYQVTDSFFTKDRIWVQLDGIYWVDSQYLNDLCVEDVGGHVRVYWSYKSDHMNKVRVAIAEDGVFTGQARVIFEDHKVLKVEPASEAFKIRLVHNETGSEEVYTMYSDDGIYFDEEVTFDVQMIEEKR